MNADCINCSFSQFFIKENNFIHNTNTKHETNNKTEQKKCHSTNCQLYVYFKRSPNHKKEILIESQNILTTLKPYLNCWQFNIIWNTIFFFLKNDFFGCFICYTKEMKTLFILRHLFLILENCFLFFIYVYFCFRPYQSQARSQVNSKRYNGIYILKKILIFDRDIFCKGKSTTFTKTMYFLKTNINIQ